MKRPKAKNHPNTIFKQLTINLNICRVSLPVWKFKFGKSKRKIGFVSGIHGNEDTGPVILHRLAGQIIKNGCLVSNTEIIIIPTLNPLGTLLNTRNEPISQTDLNRNFSSDLISNNISEQITKSFSRIFCELSWLIDIHSSPNDLSIPHTLSFISENPKINKESLSLLSTLNFPVNFVFDTRNKSHKFNRALGFFLIKKDIPCIVIETENLATLPEKQINLITNNLMNNLVNRPFSGLPKDLEFSEQLEIFSNTSGFFFPKLKPEQVVKKDCEVGKILKIEGIISTKIINPHPSSKIVVIKRPEFITMGTRIAILEKPLKLNPFL